MSQDANTTEITQHADDCLRVTSSSAAACSCGVDRAARIAERDAWQNGMEVAEMTQAQVDALLEYSTTLPTGKTIGKQWKRYLHIGPKAGSWVLCEYVEDPDPAFVAIASHLIRVAESPGEVWECGPHANAWNGHDARCRRVTTPPD